MLPACVVKYWFGFKEKKERHSRCGKRPREVRGGGRGGGRCFLTQALIDGEISFCDKIMIINIILLYSLE